MKHRFWIYLFLFITLASFPLTSAQIVNEVIENGDFEDGDDGSWFTSGSARIQTGTVYHGVYAGELQAVGDWLRQPYSSVWNSGTGGIVNYTILDFYGTHDGSGNHTINVIVDYHDETFDLIEYNLTGAWEYRNILPDVNQSLGIYAIRWQSPAGASVDFFIDNARFYYESDDPCDPYSDDNVIEEFLFSDSAPLGFVAVFGIVVVVASIGTWLGAFVSIPLFMLAFEYYNRIACDPSLIYYFIGSILLMVFSVYYAFVGKARIS